MGFYDDFAINIYIYMILCFFFTCNSTLFKQNLYDIFLSVHECLSKIWLRRCFKLPRHRKDGGWCKGNHPQKSPFQSYGELW